MSTNDQPTSRSKFLAVGTIFLVGAPIIVIWTVIFMCCLYLRTTLMPAMAASYEAQTHSLNRISQPEPAQKTMPVNPPVKDRDTRDTDGSVKWASLLTILPDSLQDTWWKVEGYKDVSYMKIKDGTVLLVDKDEKRPRNVSLDQRFNILVVDDQDELVIDVLGRSCNLEEVMAGHWVPRNELTRGKKKDVYDIPPPNHEKEIRFIRQQGPDAKMLNTKFDKQT